MAEIIVNKPNRTIKYIAYYLIYTTEKCAKNLQKLKILYAPALLQRRVAVQPANFVDLGQHLCGQLGAPRI